MDHVYWLDPLGGVRISWPKPNVVAAEFSPPDIVQRARIATSPVFEVGIAAYAGTTLHPGVIIAEPVRTRNGNLVGIVVANLSLVELSDPVSKSSMRSSSNVGNS